MYTRTYLNFLLHAYAHTLTLTTEHDARQPTTSPYDLKIFRPSTVELLSSDLRRTGTVRAGLVRVPRLVCSSSQIPPALREEGTAQEKRE